MTVQTDTDRIFTLVERDSATRRYFMRELRNSPAFVHWFSELVQRGYFSAQHDPRPERQDDGLTRIPLWDVMEVLTEASGRVDSCPELSQPLEAVFQAFHDDFSQRPDRGSRNSVTDWKLLEALSVFPLDRWRDSEWALLERLIQGYGRDSVCAGTLAREFMTNLLGHGRTSDIARALVLMYGWQPSEADDASDKVIPNVDTYWLNEIIERRAEHIGAAAGNDVATWLAQQIRDLARIRSYWFDSPWIDNIASLETSHKRTSSHHVLLVWFLVELLRNSPAPQAENWFDVLWPEDLTIFKRICLYLLDRRFDILKTKLVLREGQGGSEVPQASPARYDYFAQPRRCFDETVTLLRHHAAELPEAFIEHLVDSISRAGFEVPAGFELDEPIEVVATRYRIRWLRYLQHANSPVVSAKIDEYQSLLRNRGVSLEPLTELFPEEDDDDGWSAARRTSHECIKGSLRGIDLHNIDSAFPATAKSNDHLDYLDRIQLVAAVVSETPAFYVTQAFGDTALPSYVPYAVLRGLADSQRREVPPMLDWGTLLGEIRRLVENDTFWGRDEERRFAVRGWTLGAICDLIREWNGTPSDPPETPSRDFDLVRSILLLIHGRFNDRDEPIVHERDQVDAESLLTDWINTVRGKLYSAMIPFSLKEAKAAGRTGTDDNRWDTAIRDAFTTLAEPHADAPWEFYGAVGYFLPNLYWLDQGWVSDRFDFLFPHDRQQAWFTAMTFYLMNSRQVYIPLYSLHKSHDDYTLALGDARLRKSSHAARELVVHVLLAYYAGEELLDDSRSLIRQLLDTADPDLLGHLIHVVWARRSRLQEDTKNSGTKKAPTDYVKALWQALFNLTSERTEKEFRDLRSSLATWVQVVPTLDSDCEAWLTDAASVLSDRSALEFVKGLVEVHLKQTPATVGRLLVAAHNGGYFSSYHRNEVTEVVKALFESGDQEQRQIANSICDLHAQRGFYFLRDLWERHGGTNQNGALDSSAGDPER